MSLSESLFEAVVAGDLERVQSLLAGGADPNPFDAEGRTPLMIAAERGEEDIVRALLARGADPALTDRLGEGALSKAAAHGHRGLATLLYAHASRDEQDMARALLQVGTDFFTRAQPTPPPSGEGLRRKLASASAYLSSKLGDEVPTQRMERLARAEKHGKK